MSNILIDWLTFLSLLFEEQASHHQDCAWGNIALTYNVTLHATAQDIHPVCDVLLLNFNILALTVVIFFTDFSPIEHKCLHSTGTCELMEESNTTGNVK